MYMKFWKVYGVEGHRQRQSFGKSESFTTWDGVKILVLREDYTETNDYVLFGVILDTPDGERAERNLYAQVSDGVFENSRVGDIEEWLETEI